MKNSIKFILLSSLSSITPFVCAGGGGEFAYIYTASTQDIKSGDGVSFDLNGPKTAGINYIPGKSDITILHEGNYLISFFAATTGQSSFGLFLDGNPIDGGTYGGSTPYGAGAPTNGQVIVKAKAGSVLTLRNYSPIQKHGTATIMIGSDSQKRTPVKSTVTSSITIVEL